MDISVELEGSFTLQDEPILALCQKLATLTDVDGSLNLITGEYPNVDTSFLDVSDSWSYIDLKLVFDSRAANKLKINFNLFLNEANFFITVTSGLVSPY